jgi:hypothetical protein
MEKDKIRYKVEHMGDYFVDLLTKVVRASKSSARGVILTYDIHCLTKKNEALITDIGTRVVQISKVDPSFVQDEKLRELMGRQDETDKKLSAYVEERKNILYPSREFCSAGTTMADAPNSV